LTKYNSLWKTKAPYTEERRIFLKFVAKQQHHLLLCQSSIAADIHFSNAVNGGACRREKSEVELEYLCFDKAKELKLNFHDVPCMVFRTTPQKGWMSFIVDFSNKKLYCNDENTTLQADRLEFEKETLRSKIYCKE
jgi:hypothetical protein